MVEIWKDVVGLEDYAEISNLGAIRTKDRYINNNGTQVLYKGRIKKATDNGLGYLQVRFTIDGEKYRKYIHRMVVEAFIGVNEHLDVNHIDHDKSNNSLSNLEYVSRSENLNKMHEFYETYKKSNKCKDCNKEIGQHSERCRKCEDDKRVTESFNIIPSKNDLIKFMTEYKSFEKVGRIYSVSGNTIKRWCEKHGMPKYIKDYKNGLVS